MATNLVPTREAVRRTGLHANTLRRYFDSGKIKGRRAENGARGILLRALGDTPFLRFALGCFDDQN